MYSGYSNIEHTNGFFKSFIRMNFTCISADIQNDLISAIINRDVLKIQYYFILSLSKYFTSVRDTSFEASCIYELENDPEFYWPVLLTAFNYYSENTYNIVPVVMDPVKKDQIIGKKTSFSLNEVYDVKSEQTLDNYLSNPFIIDSKYNSITYFPFKPRTEAETMSYFDVTQLPIKKQIKGENYQNPKRLNNKRFERF
jgi:hypothetical protein